MTIHFSARATALIRVLEKQDYVQYCYEQARKAVEENNPHAADLQEAARIEYGDYVYFYDLWREYYD